MNRWLLIFVLAVPSVSVSEEKKIVSTYGRLPDPRVPFDESNYPNQAFSTVERNRFHEEYGKYYTKAYILEFSKMRDIPPYILPATFILTSLKKVSTDEGSFQINLKNILDKRMVDFENAGGIDFYNFLNKKTKDLEAQVAELREAAPSNSPSHLFDRIARLKEQMNNPQQVVDRLGSMQPRIDELSHNIAELQWYIRIGWALFVIILIGTFRSWRYVANNKVERRII